MNNNKTNTEIENTNEEEGDYQWRSRRFLERGRDGLKQWLRQRGDWQQCKVEDVIITILVIAESQRNSVSNLKSTIYSIYPWLFDLRSRTRESTYLASTGGSLPSPRLGKLQCISATGSFPLPSL